MAKAMARSAGGKQMTAAQIKKDMAERAEKIQQRIGSPETNAISLKDKLFTLPDGQIIQNELRIVIVDFTSWNRYYDRPFDPKNPRPPVCFAQSDSPNGMRPSKNAPLQQSDECDVCPKNEFGSGIGDGKACKNQRLLAVAFPEDPEAKLYTLSVPPASLKAFDGYVGAIARMHKVEPVAMITKIRMHPESTYTKLIFDDPVPNEQLALHYNKMQEARTLLETEPDTSGLDLDAKPKPRRKKR